MFPLLHLLLFLHLSFTCHGTSYYRTLLQQPNTNSSSASTPCPLDFNALRNLINQSSKRPNLNSTTQCQYIRQGLRLVQSEYLRRTNSFFPPLTSAESCWNSYQSSVNDYVPNFDIRKSCGFQTSWISQGCMNITTRFEFESNVSVSALSNMVSSCNQSLENNSPCATCTTSFSGLASYLNGPSVGNVSDCTAYPSIYAAAFANQFGPTDEGTIKCLFAIDVTATASSGKGKKNVTIIVVVLVCGLVLVFVGFGYWILWRRRKYRLAHKWNDRRIESNLSSRLDSISGSTTLIRFTIDEIKLATKNFARANIVGTGGYGNVYKGVLPGGIEVALKRFKNCSVAGDASFTHEVEVIASVRHVNLVALRGYCTATTPYEGHQRIIVCDLMKNGSLHDHLFGTRYEKLSWGIRQKVALGTARGLAYLHYGAQPGIIHRDIKASNILLDESFEPKVADFGLAKFTPEGMTHLSTRVAGTMGYVAPEYALYGQLTERSDVYSFGVVLLELLSGKKAIIEFNDGQPTLVTDWAWSLVREGRALDVLEDNIPDLGPPEVVEKYVLVAVLCSHPQLYARPTMDQVVNMLDADIPVPTIPERPISLIADLDDIERSVSSSFSGNLSTAAGYQPYIIEREAPLADSDSVKDRSLD
ncbi:PREDICTED: probable LRR receptor-like serine/threonine-protein kinase RKF3 [Nicotiana attenuata]|uniref:non-specific serine/threonine protein kinase n=1 Tax=Nicotiana attenuata TaxID=49451 RepID=A0A314LFY3_NICAT|nr:PREDICTED: probable LRR receptor-like serine/threonine-protein kinase RKF3 [Nicotiana attenuata]OIT39484.1 putative lrr receptor-like serinethreonine-protein kinase rkf3 [Nicotiana attenuata]